MEVREEVWSCWAELKSLPPGPESGKVLRARWEWRRGPGGAAATPPGRICPRPRSRPRPSQDLPTRAARSFSDSCSRSPARLAVLCLARVSPPIVPSDDHPADCSPRPGTLGFPPRGRQGLRTTSRHFPGKSVLGRAWERGAFVGWRCTASRGRSGWLELRGDRGGAHPGVLCAERSMPSAILSQPPRSRASGLDARRVKAKDSFVSAPRKRGAALRADKLCAWAWRPGAPQTLCAGS